MDQEVEVMITTNDGGLGPVTHSFPRAQKQRGRGTIKGSTTTRSTTHQRNEPDPPYVKTT